MNTMNNEAEIEFRKAIFKLLGMRFHEGKLRLEDYKRIKDKTLWKDVLCTEKEFNRQKVVDVFLTLDLRILSLCFGTHIRKRARKLGLKENFQGDYRRYVPASIGQHKLREVSPGGPQ